MTVICLLQIMYFEYLCTSWFKRKCSQRQQIIGIFSFKWNSPSSGFQWKCWGESMASPEHWNDEWKHTAKLDIYSKLPAFTPWKVTFLLPVQEIRIISLPVHIQNPTRSQCKHKFPHMFSSMWSSAQIHVQPKKKKFWERGSDFKSKPEINPSVSYFQFSKRQLSLFTRRGAFQLHWHYILCHDQDLILHCVFTENCKRCWEKKMINVLLWNP